MNSALALDLQLGIWIRQGLSRAENLVRQAEFMMGWPYAWGAVGADCTPEKREYYRSRGAIGEGDRELIRKRCQVLNGTAAGCEGCKYYPDNTRTRINDCQGFLKSLCRGVGITLAGGGCTSMWENNSNWTEKGPIERMPAGQVCAVFQHIASTGKMDHVGLHIGDGAIIHCSVEVRRGKTTDKGWTHYAIPKGMDGRAPMIQTKPTLRKGSAGEYVAECQQELIRLGYGLEPYGADGKFGKITENAVKLFQENSGLEADGIVGRLTWDALERAAGTEEAGAWAAVAAATHLYTVTIPHLQRAEAAMLETKYAGCTVQEEAERGA